jgi:hypothetical protein
MYVSESVSMLVRNVYINACKLNPPVCRIVCSSLKQCSATFFSPAADPNLSKTHDGTPLNFRLTKSGYKTIYMTINMYLHTNSCPIRMQAYENKTTHVE